MSAEIEPDIVVEADLEDTSSFIETMSNFSLSNLIDYDCPVYGNNSDYIIGQVMWYSVEYKFLFINL